jgi:hypothetical protein
MTDQKTSVVARKGTREVYEKKLEKMKATQAEIDILGEKLEVAASSSS